MEAREWSVDVLNKGEQYFDKGLCNNMWERAIYKEGLSQ